MSAGRNACWFFYGLIKVVVLVQVAPMSKPVQQALRTLIWQSGWVLVSTAFVWSLVNQRWAWSVMVGAGIGLLSTGYVLLVMVKHVLNVTKPATLFTVLITWLIKTMLVVGLLLIAFRSPRLVPLAVMIGLMGSLVAYWLSVYLRAGSK
jgi:hypothetical protein